MKNTIFVNYGADMASMTRELMQEADVSSLVPPGARVYIKPNLVNLKPASEGSTTHTEIVEGILQYLQSAGVDDIHIFESSSMMYKTKDAVKACGYDVLCRNYGIPFIDLDNDRTVNVDSEGVSLKICRTAVEADFIINVPVMKGHCQTDITCCLKNMKGLIPDSEKSRYHTMGLHRPIAALASAIRPMVHIVDAVCGDPTFELGGSPVESNRIMLGFDPVLMDSYCAELLGYRPDEIGYLRYAKESGVGSYIDGGTRLVELNAGNKTKAADRQGAPGALGRKYRKHIDEDGACSPCYAALITALNRLGETGVPSGRIKIGQGFRGSAPGGIGVGNCAAGCEYNVKGCPPSAADIVEMLSNWRANRGS